MEGFNKGRLQERKDAGMEGFRKEGMLERRDEGPKNVPL